MSDDANKGSDESPDPQIIPPSREGGNLPPSIYAEIAANITQYTDRPDLLLEVVEKYDPGFIKSMNQEAKDFSRKNRDAKFRFGRFQSYTSVVVAAVAALGAIGVMFLLAWADHLNFMLVVGLGIFFAISQSGASGFLRIVNQLVEMITGQKADGK